MMLSLRTVLLAVLLAGVSHVNAQAQVPDGAALLPSSVDAVKATPTETGEPVPQTSRHGQVTLEVGRDGEVVLEFSGATRREILNRLLAERDVEIEWRNKAVGDERLQGRRLGGSPFELARRLLAHVNYLMFYDTGSNEPRLARIVILGSDPPSVTRSAGHEAQASEAARRRAAIDAARRAITAAQRR
jgi:hypothetical protein